MILTNSVLKIITILKNVFFIIFRAFESLKIKSQKYIFICSYIICNNWA